ncbi:uncharacterized protein [Ptychodera flava]|uniref:uncharacterized protein n=1 Tax=Ptychodera flava TaxID=63121 RepID=UPI00396A9733
MNIKRRISRTPFSCQWLTCILVWNLSELCHCQDAFTPNSGNHGNAAINDDISLALIIVAVVLLATFLCVCCAACRNSLCPDDQTDSDAATDSPDTPNLLSCEIEINDIIPPTYSNLVAEGIIEEEEENDNRGRETSVAIEPITPPPNYDIVFKPSWPRSASAYVLHPERIEEVAMADLYTRQTSRTSERNVRSENSINRSVSFADEVVTSDENVGSDQNDGLQNRNGANRPVTSDGSTPTSPSSNDTDTPREESMQSPHSVSESEAELSPEQNQPSEQFESQVHPSGLENEVGHIEGHDSNRNEGEEAGNNETDRT